MNSTARHASLLIVFGWIAANGSAQTPKVDFPEISPTATLRQHIGLTDIEITYSRPSVSGRKIFGNIVPYGQVWRPGANAPAKISFSTPVRLNTHDIPAGQYLLFTIPGEEKWTIILSKDVNASEYNPENDLARLETSPVKLTGQGIDTFVIEFNHIRDDSALLELVWEKTVVPIRLQVDVIGKVVPQIDAALASPDKRPAQFYLQAATFYFDHGLDVKKALAWLDTGLADKPKIGYELLNLKARILAKEGDKDGALAAAKQSSELAIQAEGPNSSWVKLNQDVISNLR